MDGAGEALQFFMDRGDTIIIFSVVPEKAVRDWMDYFDLPYHEITNKKPLADVYLDDKGLRFTSWQQALTDIVSLDGTKP